MTENLLNKINNFYESNFFKSDSKERVKDYLMNKKFKHYFDNTTDKERYKTLLEQNIDKTFDKYKNNLESKITKMGTSLGAGIGGVDVYTSLNKMEFNKADNAAGTLIAAKTAFELPQVYSYLKNTMDVNALQGLGKYALKKAAGILVPFVGPLVEGGALKDMFLDRVMYESKNGFLKDIGKYESLTDRVKKRVENVAGIINSSPPAYI